MALADDLQVLAFREVLAETNEYRLRFLYRWYSKTFATPLHRVSSIPLTDVLEAFWEERYEKMEPEELETERGRLLETDAERLARLIKEDRDKVELESFVEEVKATAAVTQKIPDLKVPAPVKTQRPIPEPSLPEASQLKKASDSLPENISIKFTPTDFFDELINRLDGIDPGDDEQSSS